MAGFGQPGFRWSNLVDGEDLRGSSHALFSHPPQSRLRSHTQNDNEGLSQHGLVAAPGEAVLCAGVGYGQQQSAITKVGDLCILAEQNPGEAPLGPDFFKDLRPELAHVGDGEADLGFVSGVRVREPGNQRRGLMLSELS